MAYLGDANTTTGQRFMTTAEVAGFLARHPLVATMVAETKAAILLGAYDWNYYDHVYQPLEWVVKFPGIIEPIGMEVEDSYFGRVVIFPARNGEIYFSAFAPTDLGTDVPTTGEGSYEPPAHPGGFFEDLQNTLVLALIVGGIYLFSRSES